ncbi:flavodoxin family protein [Anaerorhabdus sp.]|jgi:flavodoxin I|uniref:flavodoxin family protein n=1 Tax=Anaerorhabdus sp. TaxID=1872524 RepID=UPI002FCBB36C
MEYAIVYVSKTGNTKKLVDIIKKCIPGDCVYEGDVTKTENLPELVFVGSGAENGNFYPTILEFLKNSRNKNIFLFGTVRFQKTQTYYDRVIKNVKTCIYPGNKLLGEFLCQGKMPLSIKEKCEKMDRKTAKFDIDAFLKGFDETSKHPNEDDYKNFEKILSRVFPK